MLRVSTLLLCSCCVSVSVSASGCLLFATNIEDGGRPGDDAGIIDIDRDAGAEPEVDGGIEPDPVEPDAEPSDGGSVEDGGPPADAGRDDGGATDAGGGLDDGGQIDGGLDAGPNDAGLDAGLNDAGAPEDDAGPLVVQIDAVMLSNAGPFLNGDTTEVSLTGSNVHTITDLSAPGVIFGNLSSPGSDQLLARMDVADVNALLSSTASRGSVTVTVTVNEAPDVSFVLTITVHRAHGPYVSPDALAANPCGHERRPCATLAAAATHFGALLDTYRDSPWELDRVLRIESTFDPIAVPATVVLDGIGLEGGYSERADGQQWTSAGDERTTLQLAPQTTLIHVGQNNGSERVSNIILSGGAPTDIPNAALVVRGNTDLSVASIYGAVSPGLVSVPVFGIDVEAAGTLQVNEGVEVYGVIGSVTQDPGAPPFEDGAEICAVRSAGALNILGGAFIGATAATWTGNVPAIAPAITAVKVTGGVINATGTPTFLGGSGTRLFGISVGGDSDANIGSSIEARCGTATTNDGQNELATCRAGLFATSGGVSIGGTYVGSASSFDGTSIGLDIRTTGLGPYVVRDGTTVALADSPPAVTVAFGMRIISTGDQTQLVALGDISVQAHVTALGAGINVRRGASSPPPLAPAPSLQLESDSGKTATVTVTTGVGATIAHGIDVADVAASVNVDATITVTGPASSEMTGVRNLGSYIGRTTVDVTQTGLGTATGFACASRGNSASLHAHELTLGDEGAIPPLASTVSALNDAIGVAAQAGCTASLKGMELSATSSDEDATALATSSDVFVSSSSLNAESNARSVGASVECTANTVADFAGTGIVAQQRSGGATPRISIGVEVLRAKQPKQSCASFALLMDNVTVFAADAANEAIAVSLPQPLSDSPPVDTIPYTRIDLRDSSFTAHASNESRGLDIDMTAAALLLDKSVVSVERSGGATTDKVGVDLHFAGEPEEINLWNNHIVVAGAGAGTGVRITSFELAPSSTPYPSMLIYNTIDLTSDDGDVGLELNAAAPNGGGTFVLATLAGNAILSDLNAVLIKESCRVGAIGIANAPQQTFTLLSSGNAFPVEVYEEDLALCLLISDVTGPPERYENGVIFADTSDEADSDGCVSTTAVNLPSTATVGGLEASTIFEDDFKNDDFLGVGRVQTTTLPGRCNEVP